MENLPFKQNINWTQLVGLLATVLVLATGGKINLDLVTQAAIVTGIQSLVAIITWVQHTFVNHPDNQVKAEAMVTKAVAAVKGKSPVLALILVSGLALSFVLNGCAGIQTPQQALAAAEFGYETAQATYNAICSVNAPPYFCTDPDNVANYNKSRQAITAAFQAAEAAIAVASDPNATSIAHAIAAVQQAWIAYNAIVNEVQAKNAKLRGMAYRPIPL